MIELRAQLLAIHIRLPFCFPREIRYRYIYFCFLPLVRESTLLFTLRWATLPLSRCWSRDYYCPQTAPSNVDLGADFGGCCCCCNAVIGARQTLRGRDSFTENILSNLWVDDFRNFLRNFFTNFTCDINFVSSVHFCTELRP